MVIFSSCLSWIPPTRTQSKIYRTGPKTTWRIQKPDIRPFWLRLSRSSSTLFLVAQSIPKLAQGATKEATLDPSRTACNMWPTCKNRRNTNSGSWMSSWHFQEGLNTGHRSGSPPYIRIPYLRGLFLHCNHGRLTLAQFGFWTVLSCACGERFGWKLKLPT